MRKKSACGLVVVMIIMIALCSYFGEMKSALASSGTIKIKNASCEKGESVTVEITLNGSCNFSTYSFNVNYDAKILEYTNSSGNQSNGTIKIVGDCNTSNETIKLKFKAIAVGTSTISITAIEVYNSEPLIEGFTMSMSASTGKVTVRAPYEASTNAQLSSLKVGEGTLSPAFSKNTYDYTLTVGGGVDALTVSAKAADSKAKVSVTGNKELIEGSNTVKVTVTAEDGKTKKTYTIVVTRGKPSPTPTPTPGVMIPVGGTDLTLLDTITAEAPEGYEAGTMEYEGYTVGTLQSLSGEVTLVQLSDNALYVWSKEDGSAYPFRELKENARSYTLLKLPAGMNVPKDYVAATVTIDDRETDVYRKGADSECVLIYAMNWDGEKGWYSYDTKEGSMQRFFDVQDAGGMTETISPTPEMGSATPTPMPTGAPSNPIHDGGAKDKGSLWPWMFMLLFFVTTIFFMVMYLAERNKHVEELPAEPEEYDDSLDIDELSGHMSLRPEPDDESMESFLEKQKANRVRLEELASDMEKTMLDVQKTQEELDDLL